MKQRPRRKQRPKERPAPKPRRPLLYKVVELSTVDESSLERTLNEWTGAGWTFENVQFAMRESSKRPSMAFVFFTREGEPAEEQLPDAADRARAERRLKHLAAVPDPAEADSWSAGEPEG